MNSQFNQISAPTNEGGKGDYHQQQVGVVDLKQVELVWLPVLKDKNLYVCPVLAIYSLKS